jgi:hypothetical protein
MIKVLLSILLILSTGISLCAGDTQKRTGDDLGYYENMGALVFVYASSLFDREEVAEERLNIAREISYVMFTYWVQTRIGGLQSSRKVDVAIQKTYKQHFSGTQTSEFAAFIQDPIGWFDTDNPMMGLPKAIRGISRSEYKTILPKYRKYLAGSVSQEGQESEFKGPQASKQNGPPGDSEKTVGVGGITSSNSSIEFNEPSGVGNEAAAGSD